MRSKYAAFGLVLVLVLALDQAGKRHVSESLAIGERVPLVGSLLAWTYQPAAGGALGIFRDWSATAELTGYAVLSGVAAIVVFVFLRSLAPRDYGTSVALGAILAGVVSNSVDRFRVGASLNFLHAGPIGSSPLPDFNFADVAILLGVGTLIVELLATEIAARAAERPRRSPPY